MLEPRGMFASPAFIKWTEVNVLNQTNSLTVLRGKRKIKENNESKLIFFRAGVQRQDDTRNDRSLGW